MEDQTLLLKRNPNMSKLLGLDDAYNRINTLKEPAPVVKPSGISLSDINTSIIEAYNRANTLKETAPVVKPSGISLSDINTSIIEAYNRANTLKETAPVVKPSGISLSDINTSIVEGYKMSNALKETAPVVKPYDPNPGASLISANPGASPYNANPASPPSVKTDVKVTNPPISNQKNAVSQSITKSKADNENSSTVDFVKQKSSNSIVLGGIGAVVLAVIGFIAFTD